MPDTLGSVCRLFLGVVFGKDIDNAEAVKDFGVWTCGEQACQITASPGGANKYG